MEITYEEGSNGGRVVAKDGDTEVGVVRWRIEDGTWIYDQMFVIDGYRNQGISKQLQVAAMNKRIEAGSPSLRTVPTTAVGKIAVDGHFARNYDTDPREEVNHG